MVARNRARYLAPIALVAAITATYLVVHAAVKNKPSAAQSQVLRRTTPARKRQKPASHTSFYVVKSGDTLSNISLKTGVPLPTLETLNPNINPNALQTGERLRLRK